MNNPFIFVNLVLIPVNAFFIPSSQTTFARVMNSVAVVLNLLVVGMELMR